jgi:hypothetical protein
MPRWILTPVMGWTPPADGIGVPGWYCDNHELRKRDYLPILFDFHQCSAKVARPTIDLQLCA